MKRLVMMGCLALWAQGQAVTPVAARAQVMAEAVKFTGQPCSAPPTITSKPLTQAKAPEQVLTLKKQLWSKLEPSTRQVVQELQQTSVPISDRVYLSDSFNSYYAVSWYDVKSSQLIQGHCALSRP
jgi:hypothetical protein